MADTGSDSHGSLDRRSLMLCLAVLSAAVSVQLIRQLARFEPARIPAYANLLAEEGRHLWVISDRQSGDCLGVIAGGWKKNNSSEVVKFTAITAGGVRSALHAEVSEYKLLENLNFTLSKDGTGSVIKQISYDGRSWTGIPAPTAEPIMFMESRDLGRVIKLPNRLARALDGAVNATGVNFEEALPAEFYACKRHVELAGGAAGVKRDILKGWL